MVKKKKNVKNKVLSSKKAAVKTSSSKKKKVVKKMFTRDEEHNILVNTINVFMLFGFFFIGLSWYWLVTKVLFLDDLQKSIMFGAFGIFTIMLIFSLLLKDYGFNRRE